MTPLLRYILRLVFKFHLCKTYRILSANMMRPFPLSLGWIGLVAIGVGVQADISPWQQEQMCRANEASYQGPPMPRVSKLTLSGKGCPSSSDVQIGYNYVGKWSCHRLFDVQFQIPEFSLRVENGVHLADCAFNFHVDELGEGYQLSLDEGHLEADIEISPNSIIYYGGEVNWGGGRHTVSSSFRSVDRDC